LGLLSKGGRGKRGTAEGVGKGLSGETCRYPDITFALLGGCLGLRYLLLQRTMSLNNHTTTRLRAVPGPRPRRPFYPPAACLANAHARDQRPMQLNPGFQYSGTRPPSHCARESPWPIILQATHMPVNDVPFAMSGRRILSVASSGGGRGALLLDTNHVVEMRP
jgi:hypothetical protein